MLVRPQHFQQYDRWIERLVEGRVQGLLGHGWGVRRLVIDKDALALGRISVVDIDAILPDGTSLSLPEHAPLPQPRAAPPAVKDLVVKIGVSIRLRDGAEISADGSPARRYGAQLLKTRNSAAPDRAAVDLNVATLATRLIFAGEPEDDLVVLPIVRIQEVSATGGATLAENFVPACLDIHAVPRLIAVLSEVRTLLKARGDTLSARADPSRASADSAGLVDLLTLSIINGYEAELEHFATTAGTHPETLFRSLLSLVGSLSSFTPERRKPSDLPAYRHDDLEGCLSPLVEALRRMLSVVVQHNAVSLPLQDRGYGIHTAVISDRTLFQDSRFVIAALASVPTEVLRSQLPAQMKIASVEQIRDLVNLQLPGVPIRALPVAPRELTFLQNTVYFELDQSVELWRSLPRSAAFAFHVSGPYTDLHLEFWAIRGKRT